MKVSVRTEWEKETENSPESYTIEAIVSSEIIFRYKITDVSPREKDDQP